MNHRMRKRNRTITIVWFISDGSFLSESNRLPVETVVFMIANNVILNSHLIDVASLNLKQGLVTEIAPTRISVQIPLGGHLFLTTKKWVTFFERPPFLFDKFGVLNHFHDHD